ncbi:threonine--tRNA ligase [Microbacterium sp.]|uniref:threonine--tRNA ligase n=1 Tax=Microbacterium sp. TaxID=51671 RepID=UPI0039E37B7D
MNAIDHDHRVLGRRLELFDTAPLIGAGLPMWLPDGAVIRAEIERFAAEQVAASGCRRVYTPVLAKRELFERSGHWHKFSDDMFPPMRVGGEELVLRPANCPAHTQVYASRSRSWRELPVRLAEAGTMFRSELSGVLGGLSRVRQISLDDAHAFCREDQVVDEVVLALGAIDHVYAVLGIDVDYFRLSVRGAGGSYDGDDEAWDAAEHELRTALERAGLPFRRVEGEAAFYGPKIDVQVIDAGGREETLSTVQVDRVQPERFGLSYIGGDGAKHRPVMVHRGLLSSVERLVALLIERYEGRFPTWLAPTQVDVLPVSEAQLGAAAEVLAACEEAGIRARLRDRGTLGARIRQAHEDRSAYVAVIGPAEADAGTVAIGNVQLAVADAVAAISAEIAARSLVRAL